MVHARSRLCLVRQPQRGQGDTREAEAEFLQRSAPRDRLSHSFGQFIEFIIHNFPFGFGSSLRPVHRQRWTRNVSLTARPTDRPSGFLTKVRVKERQRSRRIVAREKRQKISLFVRVPL